MFVTVKQVKKALSKSPYKARLTNTTVYLHLTFGRTRKVIPLPWYKVVVLVVVVLVGGDDETPP